MGKLLFGIEPIKALQQLLPFPLLLIFFTELGGDFAYLAIIGFIYWCLDKRAAVIAFYVLTLSAYLHYFLKMALKMERPPPDVRIVGKEDISYGFPSGHAQNAATFWSWAWLKLRRSWIALLSMLMTFVVGFSRVALGVHYLGDVVGGVVIGASFAVLSFKLGQSAAERLKDPYRLLNLILPILALVLFFVSLLIFPELEKGDPSVQLGILFGVPLGVMLERRYVNFSMDVGFKVKILRFIIGFGLIGGLMVVLPPLLPGVYLKFVRYALISLIGIFVVPLIFRSIEK